METILSFVDTFTLEFKVSKSEESMTRKLLEENEYLFVMSRFPIGKFMMVRIKVGIVRAALLKQLLKNEKIKTY